MNNKKWLFIGTDARLQICKELMIQDGNECQLVKTDIYTEQLKQTLLTFKPNHIVFSISQMKDSIPVEAFQQDARLYTGLASHEWLTPLTAAGLLVQSYLKEETYLWKNAHITAEAFVKEFYKETNETIFGQNFYVAGFGRVGKMTASLIRGMGGDVTIIASEKKELAEAKMCGFHIQELKEQCSFGDFYIVNTIPAKWLQLNDIEPLFIFDLASSPGCLTDAENLEYYRLLPGLPGKHFPVSAAKALKSALCRMNRK